MMDSARQFNGKVVLVTGAARGLGRAQAQAFAASGARVVVADINVERAMQAAQQIEGSAVTKRVDVSDERSVATLLAEVEAEFGRLDVLINNAALMLDFQQPFKPFWEIDVAEWRKTFDVNVIGVFLCCREARHLLAESRGAIVNVASDAIWAGYAGQLAYFASKGAVAVMTRCLARELGEFGIRVNAVAPGLTSSEAVEGNEFLQTLKPMIISDRALKRDQSPADVADVILFLASDKARALSGQIVPVNSGGLMR